MREFSALGAFLLGSVISPLIRACEMGPGLDVPISPATKSSMLSFIDGHSPEALRDGGLESSADGFARLRRTIVDGEPDKHGPATYADLKALINELSNRLRDELDKPRCLLVECHNRVFYDQPGAMFARAVVAFPSIAFDVEEAGRCRALDRHTASVFHLMRATEVGLQVLAQSLGVKCDGNPTWQKIINDVNGEIKTKATNKAWRSKNEEFYSGVVADISALKTAVRNPTMHVRAKYTEGEAIRVWQLVSGLLDHLATRLREKIRK